MDKVNIMWCTKPYDWHLKEINKEKKEIEDIKKRTFIHDGKLFYITKEGKIVPIKLEEKDNGN